MTQHHFCHTVLVTQTNPDTTWKGTTHGVNTRRGIVGAILEAAYHRFLPGKQQRTHRKRERMQASHMEDTTKRHVVRRLFKKKGVVNSFKY